MKKLILFTVCIFSSQAIFSQIFCHSDHSLSNCLEASVVDEGVEIYLYPQCDAENCSDVNVLVIPNRIHRINDFLEIKVVCGSGKCNDIEDIDAVEITNTGKNKFTNKPCGNML